MSTLQAKPVIQVHGLEKEILENPGNLESQVVPVWPRTAAARTRTKTSDRCNQREGRLTRPRKSFGALFMLIGLGVAFSVRTAHGQEIPFMREFSISESGEARGVAVDATGVYVAGGGNGGGFVRKHDLNGNELWNRQFDISGPAWASGVAVDATGVYVAGGGNDGGFVRKLDLNGNELWNRRVDIYFGPSGVAVDATGVYVVACLGVSDCSAFMRKYDSSGNELWTRQSNADYSLVSVAADATGVYVVGIGATDGFVRKYTAGGAERWTREFSGTNWATGVTTDATGIYVVGASISQLWKPIRSRGIPFLRKYDSSGKELWIREFDRSEVALGGSDGHVEVRGVAVDPSGVYLVGTTSFALAGQCRSGFQDAFVRKYDADGVPLWTRQFSGSSDYGSGNGVAVDATGIYVAGASSTNALLAKFEKTQPVIGESGPRILPGCVVNAANYIGGRVSPGEIVTILGLGIGPPEVTPLRLTEERRLATALADSRTLFNGIAAPLISVSADRISAIVPYTVAERPTVDVEVEYQGARSNVVTMPVAPSRPGIFTLDGSGSGHAAALNEDGSINSLSNAAERGSIIVLYATGEGLTEPVVEDGLVLGSVLPKPRLPVSVMFCCFDGEAVRGEVLYAGGAPDSVAGLLQLNVRIPPQAPEDEVEVTLCVERECSGFNRVFIRR